MSNDIDLKKYAVETMVEVSKQLITLASGFIVLTVLLLDVIIPDSGGVKSFWLMIMTWVLLLLSMLSWLFALGAVAATVQERLLYDVVGPTTTRCLQAQQVVFVMAFGLFVLFAAINYGS